MTYTVSFDKTVEFLVATVRESEGFIELHYGSAFDQSGTRLYDCGPYNATIFKDGSIDQVIAVTRHFWATQIWIELAPVSVKRDANFLLSNKLVPPIGDVGIPLQGDIAPGSITDPPQEGTTSDETGYEPQTGGRAAIGPVTISESEFLRTGDARNMLEDAKAVPYQPIWWRDEQTGKLIDLIAKPFTTCYSSPAQGNSGNWLGPFPPDPPNPADRIPWTPQTAHMMEICGIAALATGAPRYVRGVQARVIRGFAEDNYWVSQFGAVTCFNREMRGTAWLFRELFYCYWATYYAEQDGTLPADCLPSSTFKQIIDNQLAQFTKFIEPSKPFQTFGICGDGIVAWWQVDMVQIVLGLYAGKFAEWRPVYLKFLRSVMARLNGDGQNQWPPACPSWYWGSIYADAANTQMCAGYAALWKSWSFAQVAGVDTGGQNTFFLNAASLAALTADPYDQSSFVNVGDNEYKNWAYAAIAFALYHDRGDMAGAISAVFPNLEQAFARYFAMMKGLGVLIPQCSIAISPQTIQPIGAPPMSDPLANLSAAVTNLTASISAEITAIHTRITALIAAATNTGTQVDPAALQAQVDALNALNTKLQADTAALPTATS